MAKKIRQIAAFDRPREKMFKKGAAALSSPELMAVVLGSGSRDQDVLALAREVVRLAEKDFHALSAEKMMAIRGIGKAKACQVMAAIEFSRRFLIREKKKITCDRDVVALLEPLRSRKQEHFLVLTLDGANQLIEKRTVFIGTLNQSLVHPREVFAQAIADRAAAIILAHNHPSGSLEASTQDLNITGRLRQAGELLGIEVLDHIIITAESHISLREQGLL